MKLYIRRAYEKRERSSLYAHEKIEHWGTSLICPRINTDYMNLVSYRKLLLS